MKHMQNILLNGSDLKKAIKKSGFTKEQVVASVQYEGYRFSLAGLDKLYRGEILANDCWEILLAISVKCGCLVSDFAESVEIKTA